MKILLTAAVVAAMIRVGIGAVLVACRTVGAGAARAAADRRCGAAGGGRLNAGVLATQVGQALVLAVGLRVLTTPSALTANPIGALLLPAGLLVIMVRIPFALLGLLQPPGCGPGRRWRVGPAAPTWATGCCRVSLAQVAAASSRWRVGGAGPLFADLG